MHAQKRTIRLNTTLFLSVARRDMVALGLLSCVDMYATP